MHEFQSKKVGESGGRVPPVEKKWGDAVPHVPARPHPWMNRFRTGQGPRRANWLVRLTASNHLPIIRRRMRPVSRRSRLMAVPKAHTHAHTHEPRSFCRYRPRACGLLARRRSVDNDRLLFTFPCIRLPPCSGLDVAQLRDPVGGSAPICPRNWRHESHISSSSSFITRNGSTEH